MATQAISPNVTPNHIAAPTSTASIPACDTGVGRAARNPALSTQISMRSPTLTALPVLNQSVRAPTPTGQVARTEMLVMWGTCVSVLSSITVAATVWRVCACSAYSRARDP